MIATDTIALISCIASVVGFSIIVTYWVMGRMENDRMTFREIMTNYRNKITSITKQKPHVDIQIPNKSIP